MPKVFLCHSSKDKAFARMLDSRLTEQGIKVWIDETELNIGDSLMYRISDAIEDSDFVAVILSHNSVDSNWVQVELKMAMNRELSDRRIRVLPIIIESCEIPLFLKDKLYADFRNPNSFSAPFAQLLKALGIEKSLEDIERSASIIFEGSDEVQNHINDLQGFVDVKIIEVDRDRTYNPDPEKRHYNVYF